MQPIKVCATAQLCQLCTSSKPEVAPLLLCAARDLMRAAAAELTGRAEAAASMAGKASALVQLLDGLLPPLAARAGRPTPLWHCLHLGSGI